MGRPRCSTLSPPRPVPCGGTIPGSVWQSGAGKVKSPGDTKRDFRETVEREETGRTPGSCVSIPGLGTDLHTGGSDPQSETRSTEERIQAGPTGSAAGQLEQDAATETTPCGILVGPQEPKPSRPRAPSAREVLLHTGLPRDADPESQSEPDPIQNDFPNRASKESARKPQLILGKIINRHQG